MVLTDSQISVVAKQVFEEMDKLYPQIAVCNIATRRFFEIMNMRDVVNDLAGMANDQAVTIKSSASWIPVSINDAQTLVNAGNYVIGCWYNSEGHGHTVIVLPLPPNAEKPDFPIVTSCGEPKTKARKYSVPANYVYNSKIHEVEWYMYNRSSGYES